MDNKEKYEYWLDIAEYDLETAIANYKSGRYLYVVFMCQQAIEKMVKGLYILYTDEEPARTHNIARIFNKIFNQVKNRKIVTDTNFDILKEEYMEFFAELLYYYISERYPTYKQKLSTSISKKRAKKVLDKSKEVFVWLKSLSQYKI
ncbi:HEPN domain-containing protein [Schnuerera sp.]|uniref:HEPN domain-containing protein n=1 Tax=Schnuerera sp. TaxID=2794844 RepID=UPI002D14720F|nr:HEPN domain-containing protein [Schnuerera sp.]HSH35960.1 HEPN domain-containing protein [Schnuerera sp.]